MKQKQVLLASLLALISPLLVASTLPAALTSTLNTLFPSKVVIRKISPDPYRAYRYGRAITTSAPPRFNRSIGDNSGWIPLIKPAESYLHHHKTDYPVQRYQTHYVIYYPPTDPKPEYPKLSDHSPALSVVTPNGKPVSNSYSSTYGQDYKYVLSDAQVEALKSYTSNAEALKGYTSHSINAEALKSYTSNAINTESVTEASSDESAEYKKLYADSSEYKKLYPELKTYYQYYPTSLKEYQTIVANSEKAQSAQSAYTLVDGGKHTDYKLLTPSLAGHEPVYYYTVAKPHALTALGITAKPPTPIEEPAQEPPKLPSPAAVYKKAVVHHYPVISAPKEEEKKEPEIAISSHEEGPKGDEKYEFGYRVHDSHTGSEFGQMEQRHGSNSRGHYHVMLPDGRLQVVRYYTDDSGFHADVSYEGKATHHG